jgi:hypothetical protein
VLAVDPLSAYIADIIISKEDNSGDAQDTVYSALTRTRAELGLSAADGDEFPDEAYSATAAFVQHIMEKLNKEAARVVTKTLLSINTLDDAPSAEQIKKIKEIGAVASLAMLHVVQILRVSPQLVDWDYVAERVIEAGRKRAGESSEGG